MVKKLVALFKTARPRQWVKNLTLYSALIFTGNLYSGEVWFNDFIIVTVGVIVFTMLASSLYFLNDVLDLKADQEHPFKKKRPIAAKELSKTTGWIIFIAGSVFSLLCAWVLSPLFFLALGGYWLLQISYNLFLKNIEVADVFSIALGFFLRVVAGALVINAHLSIWFLLCVISTSLFLAVGKRRGELAIMTQRDIAIKHRRVMQMYSADILDSYLNIFATSAFISWALFTFNYYEQVNSNAPVGLTLLSKTLTITKWLMATIPVVIFGIMRYIRIIYDGSRAETPERVIWADIPLLVSVTLWIFLVIFTLYLS